MYRVQDEAKHEPHQPPAMAVAPTLGMLIACVRPTATALSLEQRELQKADHAMPRTLPSSSWRRPHCA